MEKLKRLLPGPMVEVECEILAEIGVHYVEAVVTGLNDNLHGKHMGYESTVSV